MTAPENIICPGLAIPFQAGAAFSINDCVKLDSSEGFVIKTAGDNEQGIGFANCKSTAQYDHVGVVTEGVVWARAAATITLGDRLMSAADGEVKTCPETAGTIFNCVGYALAAAEAENDLIPVLVKIWKVEFET